MSREGQKPIVRLSIRQREALELLAPAGARAAKEDMAGATPAFPWRINGTGRAIRTEILRQLERRGLVVLTDGEYHITAAGLKAVMVLAHASRLQPDTRSQKSRLLPAGDDQPSGKCLANAGFLHFAVIPVGMSFEGAPLTRGEGTPELVLEFLPD